jgi:hypothetical protein
MTIKDKIKDICNYSEKQINGNFAQLMYVDMISSEDEEYQRMIKQQNRELVVDAILDDKVEELNIFRQNKISDVSDVSSQYNTSSTMGVVSPKIIQINMTSQRFESYDKVWNEVVDFLNKNTQNTKVINQSLDITLQGDFEVDYRKIISKILMSSNIIAMDGRIGPSTSIIYGKKFTPYINWHLKQHDDDKISNMFTYFSDKIDDDKIIICRSNNIDQPGLLLIDNSKTGQYFFNQTPNWQKQYCWFKII